MSPHEFPVVWNDFPYFIAEVIQVIIVVQDAFAAFLGLPLVEEMFLRTEFGTKYFPY